MAPRQALPVADDARATLQAKGVTAPPPATDGIVMIDLKRTTAVAALFGTLASVLTVVITLSFARGAEHKDFTHVQNQASETKREVEANTERMHKLEAQAVGVQASLTHIGESLKDIKTDLREVKGDVKGISDRMRDGK